MKGPENRPWSKYGEHVLLELERNEKDHGGYESRLNTLEKNQAILQTKNAIIAFVAGLLASGLLTYLIGLLPKMTSQ